MGGSQSGRVGELYSPTKDVMLRAVGDGGCAKEGLIGGDSW